MKKIFFLALMTAAVLASCNQKNKEAETTPPMMHDSSTMKSSDGTKIINDSVMMKNNVAMYACPMHPEVQGKLNDKCPKCGMKLTEPVTETTKKGNE